MYTQDELAEILGIPSDQVDKDLVTSLLRLFNRNTMLAIEDSTYERLKGRLEFNDLEQLMIRLRLHLQSAVTDLYFMKALASGILVVDSVNPETGELVFGYPEPNEMSGTGVSG